MWEIWYQSLTVENELEISNRIGRENVMKIGMAGTVVELADFNPQAVNLERRRQCIDEGKPEKTSLRTSDLTKLLDASHNRTVGALHWLQILVTYVPQLKSYLKGIRERFRTEPSGSITGCRKR